MNGLEKNRLVGALLKHVLFELAAVSAASSAPVHDVRDGNIVSVPLLQFAKSESL